MIDFACKKFDLGEVIKCSLALTKSEFKLLNLLISENKQFTTEELSRELGLDKSTIQRAVKKLHGKNLISRAQINQSVGGYLFLYRIKDKEKIRKMVLDIIESWVQTFRDKISVW